MDPPVTEMLSCVAWATGLAFDRHDPPLYQLPRLSAVDVGVDGAFDMLPRDVPSETVLSPSDCRGASWEVATGGILCGRVLSDWVLSGSS